MPHPFPVPFDASLFESRLRILAQRSPYHFPRDEVPEHFRRSSVLICFWREEADLRVILTKRAATLSGYPGQMSFPGGKLEPGETWSEAAIRETEEEVGVPRDQVEVLGRLDDAWSGAGHLLVPIVGWLGGRPDFDPNPDEVEEVHTPSVLGLMNQSAYSEEEAHYGDQTFTNSILTWEEGRLFGLSTNLLIETLRWASGLEVDHGASRLESLQSFLLVTEAERREGEREEEEEE